MQRISALAFWLPLVVANTAWAADGGSKAAPAKPRSGIVIERGPTAAGPTSAPAAPRTPASQPATSRPTSQPTSQPATPTSAPAVAVDKPSWAPRLSATVKPASVALGDPVTVEIKLRFKKGVSVTLPVKLELGPFSELSRDERRAESGPKGHIPEVTQIFVLKLAAYRLGEQTLPPIEVNSLGPKGELYTLRTQAMPIAIKSVMPNEPDPKLKDVAPPVRVFQRTWWLLYLLIALAFAVVVALVTLVVYRRVLARRRAAQPPPPPTPPHIVARRRLAALDLEGLIAEEKYKTLYLELSEIIREYIGGRWGFDALEMTTWEIGEELQQHGVGSELRTRLQLYFNDCDLVKFARYRPEEDDARGAYGEAEQLVSQTQAGAPSPPAPAAAAPAAVESEQGESEGDA